MNHKRTKMTKIANMILPFFFLCMCLFLTGCSQILTESTDSGKGADGRTKIGSIMEIDAPKTLTLLDNKGALAADGLYYATWAAGSPTPYENSDGDTVDLYDAQLYLLASESTDEAAAEKNYQTWLGAAEENYGIASKDEITCSGQSYTFITYQCTSEDTPYDHGVSAFGVCGVNTVCVELTCTENYTEDLTQILTDFLNGCHYSAS